MKCKHFTCHQCPDPKTEFNADEYLKLKERFGWSFETAEEFLVLLEHREQQYKNRIEELERREKRTNEREKIKSKSRKGNGTNN
jgi:hypothetical protein